MNPDTSQLLSAKEIEALSRLEQNKFLSLPPALDLAAQAILEWRDRQLKLKRRKRNRIAKASRRKNRG